MGFGQSKLTLEEQLRESKRAINKSIRELDRERLALERQEQQLIKSIKITATKGQMDIVNIMAKDLVRIRRHIKRYFEMRSQLQGIQLRLQTVKTTEAMTHSLKGVSSIMVNMNKEMDLPVVQQMMKQFMSESERLSLSEEMVNEAVDEATFGDADESEQAKIVRQTLDEIGVDLTSQLMTAPATACASEAAIPSGSPLASTCQESDSIATTLEARLNNLRR